MRVFTRNAALGIAVTTLLLGACSDSDNNSSDNNEPFAELVEQGVTRYLGVYSPMLSETSGNDVIHSFGSGEGPLCLRGGEYSMVTRDKGSQELLIFLEGGGACWSDLCSATEEATPFIPPAGINDPNREDNPARSWNQVYVPYCDGSLHSGDRDWDDDGDGTIDRYHRGLHNLSASLDIAVSTFPSPSRILLAGNSGGGLGTVFALPLVRHLYPDVPIDVVNDSGIGVGKPDQPEFLMQLTSEWGQEAFIPESCDNCIGADGHLTDYLIWQLEQDENVNLSLLSYTQDSVFALGFLMIGGPAFQEAMLVELADQEAAHPERVRSFIPIGAGHTFVQLEPDRAIAGTTVMQWLDAMLNSPEQWNTLNELSDSP